MVAAVVEFDAGHERAHEHDAATAGAFKMGGVGGVGERVGIEAGAFIGDFDADSVGRKATRESDVFGFVHGVAVKDGVDQGLVDGEMDAEDIAPGPMQQFELHEHLVEQLSPDGGIVWDHLVASPGPVFIGRRHGSPVVFVEVRRDSSPVEVIFAP